MDRIPRLNLISFQEADLSCYDGIMDNQVGEVNMGERGKRDKGRRESKKKAKSTIKEKRKQKKKKSGSSSP